MPGFLVDTSVWLAAFFEEHEFFTRANAFIKTRSAGNPAMFCRATEQSWLRLVTTPSLHRIYNTHTTTNRDAIVVLKDWRSKAGIQCLDAEPAGTNELWLELAAIPSASPKVWMDAYLAAFAIRAGISFATLDSDFRQFEAAGLDLRLLTE